MTDSLRMKWTWREIDDVDGKNKHRSTFFHKPGGMGLDQSQTAC